MDSESNFIEYHYFKINELLMLSLLQNNDQNLQIHFYNITTDLFPHITTIKIHNYVFRLSNKPITLI